MSFTARRFPPLRNPIIVTNQDGRPEVFMIGEDYKVRHRWLLSPGADWLNPDNWSDWGCLGEDAVAILAVSKYADGRLVVFGHDPDNYTIKHKWQTEPNGGWITDWSSLNGEYADFRVETNQDGRIELFAISVLGANLHHNYQTEPNGGWKGWSALDEGISLQSIAVGKNADGRIEVFGRKAEDNTLWHVWQTDFNGGWSQWGSLGDIKLIKDKYLDTIAVSKNADGRLEVFTIDENLSVKSNWQTAPNGTWSGWGDVNLKCSRLFVGRNSNGCQELFANNDDNGGWHMLQTAPNNGWSQWESMEGSLNLFGVGNDVAGNLIVINGYRSHFGPISTESETWDTWDPEFGFNRWSYREDFNKC